MRAVRTLTASLALLLFCAAAAAAQQTIFVVRHAERADAGPAGASAMVAPTVLVVGHSNTVPDILKRLGVKDAITIADTEHDNLFIVVRPTTGDPTLIKVRY